jgi:HEAT repeat protein
VVWGLGSLVLAAGCTQGVDRPPATSAAKRASATPAQRPPTVLTDPAMIRLARIERLLLVWDQAQGAGRTDEADDLAARLRAEVDAGDADVRAAFDGGHGSEARYLATMALGFASAPDATALLVERMTDGEARMVANALLALRVRRDPATPLLPLAHYVGSEDPNVRRYAPLTLAHVLDARRERGVPPDGALEMRVLPRLANQARDRDGAVRLHAARALGALQVAGAAPALVPLLTDHREEVALAAAAALARRGEREGMLEVVRMLNEASADRKPPIAQALVRYAETLTGAPLSAAERERLGTSAVAWMRWHTEWERKNPPAQQPAPLAPRG